jgi:hypothetical protein
MNNKVSYAGSTSTQSMDAEQVHSLMMARNSIVKRECLSSTTITRTLDGHTAADYNPKSHIESKVLSGIKRERECQAHTLSSAESNTHGSRRAAI